MKNGKAVGPDDIPIEAWKSLGSLGVLMLTVLFNHILNTGKMPHQWRLSFITPIYKEKSSVQDSLRAHNRLQALPRVFYLRVSIYISDFQYGLAGSGTMDVIFVLRTLIQAYREKRTALHVVLIDLQKAFDCVPRHYI